jgi:hypothetical protein
MRISGDWELREQLYSETAALGAHLTPRDVPAQHLRDLDVEEVGRVQRLARIENAILDPPGGLRTK